MCLVPPPPEWALIPIKPKAKGYTYNIAAFVGVDSHIPFGNGRGQLTSHLTRVERLVNEHLRYSGQARFKGKAFLFLVSKKNSNASSWCIWCINFFQKQIRNKKVTGPPPKVPGVKNEKNKPHNITKPILEHSKILCMLLCCCYYSSKIICRTKGVAPVTF
jgi:hypothetical protein